MLLKATWVVPAVAIAISFVLAQIKNWLLAAVNLVRSFLLRIALKFF